MADRKRATAMKDRFKGILAEFAPKFHSLKPLAHELRRVLFPIRDETVFVGTLDEHKIMYNGMDIAFNTAIGHLGEEEQAMAQTRRARTRELGS